MQTECRTTSLLDCYAEVLLILCKDNYFIAVEVKNGDYLPKSNSITTIWVKNPYFFALIPPSSSLRVPFLLHQVQCPIL